MPFHLTLTFIITLTVILNAASLSEALSYSVAEHTITRIAVQQLHTNTHDSAAAERRRARSGGFAFAPRPLRLLLEACAPPPQIPKAQPKAFLWLLSFIFGGRWLGSTPFRKPHATHARVDALPSDARRCVSGLR